MATGILKSDTIKKNLGSSGLADFILVDDLAYIFGEDMILKKIKPNESENFLQELVDLNDEVYACCNLGPNSDFYLFGGETKQVEKVKIESQENAFTMLETNGKINYLDMALSQNDNDTFFATTSNENKLYLYDLNQERTFMPKETECHDSQTFFTKLSHSSLNEFDSDYVGSIASDGSMCFYKIKPEEDQSLEKLEFIKKLRITSEIKNIDSTTRFGFDYSKDIWTDKLDYPVLLLSGKESLQKLSYNQAKKEWELNIVEEVNHSEKIVNVLKLNQSEGLVTVSLDKKLKLWRMNKDGIKLAGEFDLESSVLKMLYESTTDTLHLLDSKGYFYSFNKVAEK